MNIRAHELLAYLPALAERTSEQLKNLHADPTPDRCDVIVRALHEAQSICRQLAMELLRGEPPTV